MTLTTMNSNKENAINMKEFGFSMRTRNTLHSTYDTELLSSELFSIEQLKRHGVMLAGQYKINPHPGVDQLLPRLADNERVILAA